MALRVVDIRSELGVMVQMPPGELAGRDPTRHGIETVSYTHLRAHETVLDLVCRLLLEKKKETKKKKKKQA